MFSCDPDMASVPEDGWVTADHGGADCSSSSSATDVISVYHQGDVFVSRLDVQFSGTRASLTDGALLNAWLCGHGQSLATLKHR